MGLLDKQSMMILGGILFLLGFVILYAIGKRKFNRRTMTGAEVFRSYESSWSTRLAEGVLRIIALFMMLSGASAMILSCE